MNLTISNATNSSAFKHLKGQYIAAVCGIALAATAVVIGATWPSKSGSGVVGTPRVSEDISSGSDMTTHREYVVVDSSAEAKRLEGVFAADSYNWVMPQQIDVIVVNTPEQEARLVETANEQMILGNSFHVTDLRPTTPVVSTNLIERAASLTDLDARIMAGVISSERASYAFDAVPANDRQVSETDIMMGVTSTEHAAWSFPTE